MQIDKKKGPRGGARAGAGRHPVGRSYLVIRIKDEVLQALAPDAARVIRELVEEKYAHLISRS